MEGVVAKQASVKYMPEPTTWVKEDALRTMAEYLKPVIPGNLDLTINEALAVLQRWTAETIGELEHGDT